MFRQIAISLATGICLIGIYDYIKYRNNNSAQNLESYQRETIDLLKTESLIILNNMEIILAAKISMEAGKNGCYDDDKPDLLKCLKIARKEKMDELTKK